MLLQVFSIPSALILSIIFLKVKYSKNHFIALGFCALGVACSVINDVFVNPRENEYYLGFNYRALIGDLMVLTSAFMFAT
jgi:drug/metabolite transporter (DMT)-like permease